MTGIGRQLVLLGGAVLLVGLVLTFGGRFLSLGRLPGDIVIKRESFTLYFPLGTSLLVSAVLSLILYLFRR